MKRGAFWAAVMLATAIPVNSVQKVKRPKSSPSTTRPALSDEEKEILKQRELLENLELLQNYEKIQYMDFLAQKKPTREKNKQQSRTAAKTNEQKNAAP